MYDIHDTLNAVRTKHSSHLHGMPAPSFVRTYAPFALARLGGGSRKILILNQYRLPIGIFRGLGKDHDNLKQWASRAITFRDNPFLRDDLWCPIAPLLYLHSPGESSDYIERLEKISQLALEPLEARKAFGLVGGLRAR